MADLSWRSFFAGLGAFIAAPAIVPIANLMPVRGIIMPVTRSSQLLTLDMITREAIRLFVDSNAFIRNFNNQCADDVAWAQGGPPKIRAEFRIHLPCETA